MTALDLLTANLESARQRVAVAEVALLRAAFPFQRTTAIEALSKCRRQVLQLETLCARASAFEDEDEVAFLGMRAPSF